MSRSVDLSKILKVKTELDSRNSNFSSVSVKFFTFKGTSARLRVMPPWSDEEPWAGQFWRTVAQHWGVTEEFKGPLLCPKKTPFMNRDCPICDFVDSLKAKANDPAAQELAKSLNAKEAYLFSVVDMDDPEYTSKDVAEWKQSRPDKDIPFEAGDPKIQVYAAPYTVFHNIISIFHSGGDIVDLKNGHDITIQRSGKGPKTKYQVTPNLKPSRAPVSESTDLPDLSQVGIVLDYDQLFGKLSSGIGADYQDSLPGVSSHKALGKGSNRDDDDDADVDPKALMTAGAADEDDDDLEAEMRRGLRN